jgi:RNA polymerase sigma-70 factor, ECF subfamily
LSTMATNVEDAFIRYGDDVYRFLVRRTGNHCDAEELTQQVFADAASALARSEPPRSMRAWLYAVAERRLIDELRRRKRAAEAIDLLGSGLDRTDDAHCDAVGDAVARLPLVQRQIVVLRVVEGRTYGEIAAAVGCNESACKMRLSRALRRLRDDLQIAS